MGTCAKCHGIKTVECSKCGGRGYVAGVLSNKTCDACNGDRKVECPRCGGTGKG